MLAQLPAEYRSVRYVGARFPGSASVLGSPDLAEGANCQSFAYAVLRHFGLDPPPLRSRELWADTESTARVRVPRPLDLILVNETADPWGAHVGVSIGDDEILHLSAEVGRPTVWSSTDFAARLRYRTLIGHKRILRGTAQDFEEMRKGPDRRLRAAGQ